MTKTPEERSEEFLEEHMFGAEWHIGELAKVIRAAENEALERAALAVEDLTYGVSVDVDHAVAAIRALKHPVSE